MAQGLGTVVLVPLTVNWVPMAALSSSSLTCDCLGVLTYNMGLKSVSEMFHVILKLTNTKQLLRAQELKRQEGGRELRGLAWILPPAARSKGK